MLRLFRGSTAPRIWLRLAISTSGGRKLCSGSKINRMGLIFATKVVMSSSPMQSWWPVRR